MDTEKPATETEPKPEVKEEVKQEPKQEEPKPEKPKRKLKLLPLLKRYWPAIAVVLIVALAFQVRVADYPYPYLRNIDSFVYFRQMEDIIKNDGVIPPFDDLALVPEGSARQAELMPYQYIGAYSYMFFNSFMPGLELWEYLIYYPAFLASLMAIPMYFIGRALYDRKAGVIAAFFVVFDMSNMSRSLGGDPDTDAISMLMAMIVMAAFVVTYKHISEKKTLDKRGLIYTIITGIALGLYTHIWIGYWYVVWIMTGMIILKFMVDSTMMKSIKSAWKDTKHIFFSYVIFMLIFMLIFAIPFFGVQRVIYTFSGPFEFQDIKTEEGIDFPNVYVSVAELQKSGDIGTIIGRTSSLDGLAILLSPFFLMIYALLYLTYSFFMTRKHLDTVLLLLIWFIGPLTATLVAVRFSILFAAPLAIGSGILLSKLVRIATKEDEKIED